MKGHTYTGEDHSLMKRNKLIEKDHSIMKDQTHRGGTFTHERPQTHGGVHFNHEGPQSNAERPFTHEGSQTHWGAHSLMKDHKLIEWTIHSWRATSTLRRIIHLWRAQRHLGGLFIHEGRQTYILRGPFSHEGYKGRTIHSWRATNILRVTIHSWRPTNTLSGPFTHKGPQTHCELFTHERSQAHWGESHEVQHTQWGWPFTPEGQHTGAVYSLMRVTQT